MGFRSSGILGSGILRSGFLGSGFLGSGCLGSGFSALLGFRVLGFRLWGFRASDVCFSGLIGCGFPGFKPRDRRALQVHLADRGPARSGHV